MKPGGSPAEGGVRLLPPRTVDVPATGPDPLGAFLYGQTPRGLESPGGANGVYLCAPVFIPVVRDSDRRAYSLSLAGLLVLRLAGAGSA